MKTKIAKAAKMKKTLDTLPPTKDPWLKRAAAKIIKLNGQETTLRLDYINLAIAKGQILQQAKERIRKGFDSWVEQQCKIAKSTAYLYMLVAEHKAFAKKWMNSNPLECGLTKVRDAIRDKVQAGGGGKPGSGKPGSGKPKTDPAKPDLPPPAWTESDGGIWTKGDWRIEPTGSGFWRLFCAGGLQDTCSSLDKAKQIADGIDRGAEEATPRLHIHEEEDATKKAEAVIVKAEELNGNKPPDAAPKKYKVVIFDKDKNNYPAYERILYQPLTDHNKGCIKAAVAPANITTTLTKLGEVLTQQQPKKVNINITL